METKYIVIILISLVLGSLLGFSASYRTGIQPGYFEKQEAPTWRSEDKAIGSELGKSMNNTLKIYISRNNVMRDNSKAWPDNMNSTRS